MVQVTRVDAPTDGVDPAFYRAFYKDMAAKTDEEVMLHWLKHGQLEGRLPSEAIATAQFEQHPALPDDFDIDGYLNANEDVAASITWRFQAIEHFLKLGMAENRRYKPEAPKASDPDPAAAVNALESVDPVFYRAVYTDMRDADDPKCHEHFFKHGRAEGRHPNFERFRQAHRNGALIPAGFNLATYMANAVDLHDKLDHPYTYLIHYLNSGLEEKRDGRVQTVSTRFVRDYYAIDLPKDVTAEDALSIIRTEKALGLEDLTYLTAADLCGVHRVPAEPFLAIFDHEAYVFSGAERHTASPSEKPTPDNYALCLEDFLETGLDRAADISYTHKFDPEFYAKQYKTALPRPLKITPANDADTEVETDKDGNLYTNQRIELFRHWVTTGVAHAMHPNLIVWAKKELHLEIPVRLSSDLANYQRLSPDLKNLVTPGEILNHFLHHGLAENRAGVVFNEETADCFCGAAETLMRQGKRIESVAVLNQILRGSPHFPRAAHNLGDDLLRHGFHESALTQYAPLIENKTAQQWTYINASSCHEALGDEINAVRTLARGAEAFPEDVSLADRVTRAKKHFFPLILKRARQTAISLSIPAARDQMRDALSLFPNDQFGPLRDQAIRNVVIVGNHDLPQCRFYRIDQKIEHLKKAGFNVTVYRHTETLEAYHARLFETDAVIFYRVPALPPLIDAINAANILGIPTFYDMDDLLFDEDLFPPPLETYAGQISPDAHAAMSADVPLVRHAMALCRFGIASTTSLAREMEKVVHSGKVFIHKNAFGSLHERMAMTPTERSKHDQITLFYGSGTKAHKDDFHEIIEPVFTRLHQHYGDKIRFLVLGHITMTPALLALGDNLQLQEPLWDTEDYWTLLRDEADINLSVLSSTRVTDAKSEIKWLEAAMFGIPSVVSRTATHAEIIEDGETGFLCEKSDEFFEAIRQLIDSKKRRQAVGTAARDAAFAGYSIDAMANTIREIMTGFERPDDKIARKKIAVVNVFYPPQAVGGATRVVHDNVNDLIEEYGDRFEVTVFASSNGEIPYELIDYVHDGVRVTTVTTENTPNLEKRMIDPQMAVAFRRFLDREQPDLVHFHCVQRLTTSVLSEARAANIPYVITAHDGWWISDSQFLVDTNDDIDLYTYHDPAHAQQGTKSKGENLPMNDRQRAIRKDVIGARHILAVSDPFADIYRSTGLDHTITVENGVSQLPTVARTISATGRVRLAHIGGVSRHKGFHLVKHALMSRPDFTNLELLVVDHARQQGSIAREVWGSTPVTFVPKVPQKEVANLFGNIDVLLAPSIWPESYGLVTREALMCGCRVIASDRGAIGGSIDHGENGLVVSVDHIDGVRDALAEINANADYYLTPPATQPTLRFARQQARDLAALYTRILDE
ncbi:MAG: glycosyltransferase [Pseudomonadota bacterium]